MRALAAALALAFLPAASAAAPVQAAEAPQAFEAQVRVEWVDAAGVHEARLDVVSADGALRVDGPEPFHTVLASSDARFLEDEAGWSLMWPAEAVHLRAAALAAKYEVVRMSGEAVAGRPTTRLDVRERGARVETLALDEQTGLVLRRQMYDRHGTVVRTIEVVELRLGSARPATPPRSAPARPGRPHLVARVPAPFSAPARLDGDFERVAVYQRGHTVHLLYSDGLHALSVFAEAGRMGPRPAGGQRVVVGDGHGFRYSWPGGDVLMWEAGGLVYTAVGDAPAEDVRAAAASMPGGRSLPLDDRLRRASRRLVEALTGGA